MSHPDPLSFIGIDIGGTATKFGRIRDDGEVLAESSIPTNGDRSPDHLIRAVVSATQAWRRDRSNPVVGVGVGVPGPLDLENGRVLEPVNLPGWRHFPLQAELARAMGLPVFFANDANAAAYGEYWLGGGQDCDSLVLLTLGTGVGGGMVIADKMIPGSSGNAAECGHITVDWSEGARRCPCGQAGHLEACASATAVGVSAMDYASQSRFKGSVLHTWAAEGKRLTALDVYRAASQNDLCARHIIEETADWLIRGIANIACMIDPDRVLLGGAMDFGGAADPVGAAFLQRIRAGVAAAVFPQIAANLHIGFASLGPSAGWIGAAGLARQAHRIPRNASQE